MAPNLHTVVFENNGTALWGCADRAQSSNSRGDLYFACLSGRIFLPPGERSVFCDILLGKRVSPESLNSRGFNAIQPYFSFQGRLSLIIHTSLISFPKEPGLKMASKCSEKPMFIPLGLSGFSLRLPAKQSTPLWVRFILFYNCNVPFGISSMGNSGCFPRGKPAATDPRYPSNGAWWVI